MHAETLIPASRSRNLLSGVSGLVVAVALVVHGLGALACLHEPRRFDLWMIRAMRCPRVRHYRFWQCNSYFAKRSFP